MPFRVLALEENLGFGPANNVGLAAARGEHVSRPPDLRRWSAPALLWAVPAFRSQPEPGTYYAYPSLVDHASPSPVFDSVTAEPGRAQLHLYLTRLNLEDRRRGGDRDLVRVRVGVPR